MLAPAGDLKAWCESLAKVASSPEVRRRWGARGREVALERFSWERVGARFEGLLERLYDEDVDETDSGDADAPGALFGT